MVYLTAGMGRLTLYTLRSNDSMLDFLVKLIMHSNIVLNCCQLVILFSLKYLQRDRSAKATFIILMC